MIKLNYRFTAFARRFIFFACCNLFDAVILFQGHGIRTQTALIAVYRWALYTPKYGDLRQLIDDVYKLLGIHHNLKK